MSEGDSNAQRAWASVQAHAERLASVDLGATVSSQGATLLQLGPLHVDLSKQRLDAGAWADLYALADACGLDDRRRALYRGEVVNPSEGRPALHMGLRARAGEVCSQGRDCGAQALEERTRAHGLLAGLDSGELRGATGAPIRALIHVGIGGSVMGPRLVVDALAEFSSAYRPERELRFLSNIDPQALANATAGLDPATTLICVASKSFATAETLGNAEALRAWLRQGLGPRAAVETHFVAATSRPNRAAAWGVPASQTFKLPVGVGGRFSLWSVLNFAAIFALGPAHFDALLAGARDMDLHFMSAPWSGNLPARVGLLNAYLRSAQELGSRCVVPYDERLRGLVPHLQQLHMESNGKGVDRHGVRLAPRFGAPVVWGGIGSDSQHAFFQQLHQGAEACAVDFVAVARPNPELGQDCVAHSTLLANCFAQSRALMLGNTKADPPPAAHARSPGGRGSVTYLLDELTPYSLGALLAMHEHEVFVQGVVWGLNSFDQWGVELGKQIARELGEHAGHAGHASDGDDAALDPSTRALLDLTRPRS